MRALDLLRAVWRTELREEIADLIAHGDDDLVREARRTAFPASRYSRWQGAPAELGYITGMAE